MSKKRLQVSNEIKSMFDKFKEHDPDLKIDNRLLATSGLNPFIIYNSSPRGLMMSSHVAQILVLEKPEKRIVYTGLENEFGKYAITKEFEHDSEVISIVHRYNKTTLGKEPTEYVVIYKDLETGKIDSMSIPYYNKFHPYFGFKYNINKDLLDNLFAGDVIPAGTKVAWPNTVLEDGYGIGVNMNMALMSLDGVAEDGFIISKSALKKLMFRMFESRSITFGENAYPLNIYGDNEHFKAFPELYEEINETSVVAASRKYRDDLVPGLMGIEDMKSFNPIFDNVVYVSGEGGKVVDIKVYKNPKKKKTLPKNTDEQLERYGEELLNFYKQIVSVYNNLNQQHKSLTGNSLVVGHEFNRLVVEAMNILGSSKENARIKKTYRKEDMDLYRVEFVIEYLMESTIGMKLTDYHGAKGVIVQIWDDENMPVDEDGNRADIIADPASTVSRLNIGRLYERYFGAASRKAKKIIRQDIAEFLNKKEDEITGDDVDKLSLEQIGVIWNHDVLEFLKLIDTPQYEIFKEAYENNEIEEIKVTLKDIVENEFYIHYNNEMEKRAYEVVLDIENSKFKPPYGPVKYKEYGKTYVTQDPVMIAPLYMMLLNKIADGMLSCASAKLNHFGLPIGVSKSDKYRLPWRNSPTRTIGETESRIFASYGGRKLLAELKDRAASVETHSKVYENILKAEKPTNIDVLIDRNKHPYGGDRALVNLETLFNSVGLDLEFVEDKHRYYEPIEKVDNKIDLDSVEHIEDDHTDDE